MSSSLRSAFATRVGLIVLALVIHTDNALGRDPFEKRTEELFHFAADGTLILENIDGSIHIYGWKETKLKLVALQKAYTTARLSQIQVEIDAQPASIHVHTTLPPARGFFADRSGTVDYTVVVPETAKLESLRVVNGEIIIEGLRGGSANAEVANGKITALNCYARVRARGATGLLSVFYQWWENLAASFDFAVGYGAVRARLPFNAQFKIDAETANGHIENGFHFESEQRPPSGQLLKVATETDTLVSFRFHTTDGNISLETTH